MFKRCFYICIVENNKKVALIILDGWGYGRNDNRTR
jgi:2,3-bisphosphoglycerate-independent phosphoglycerate mutase